MDVEWDPVKAVTNRHRHDVDFADAVAALEDPYALSRPDAHPSEAHMITIGRDTLARLIVIAWTWNEGNVRLISARLATPRERRQYAEDIDA
jgi:uncharacterized DUF497 family protein